MLKRLIIREYKNAAFAFDPTTQTALFVEGSVASLVPIFLRKIDSVVPDSYLNSFPPESLTQVRNEIDAVRDAVKGFVCNVTEGTTQTLTFQDSKEWSPMKRLSNYATKTWQLTNASLEMTYHCNLRCRWCYLDDYEQRGLAREALQKIASDLRQAGAIFILFTGGEPFLRPDLLDVMTDFSEHGFALEAKSNGLLLTKDRIRRLAGLNLFNLQISLYDITDGNSAYTGRPYQFNKIARNIRVALDHGLPLNLAVLVGKHNIDHLDEYREVIARLGVKEAFYSPYITPNRNSPGAEVELRLSRREMDEKLYPFLEKIDGLVPPVKYRKRCVNTPACYAGHDQIAINPSGLVYPCLDFRLQIGDLRNENLGRVLARRKRSLSPFKLRNIQQCWACPIVEDCDSCIGTAILENGRYDVPSQHKCEISRFYHSSYAKRRKEVTQ